MNLLFRFVRASTTCLLFFLLLAGLYPSQIQAFSSPNVPVGDPVYRDIDKLVAAGLVKDVLYTQRPWSRDEIARIISVALTHFETMKDPVTPTYQEVSLIIYVENILEKLKKEYEEELIDRGAIEGKKKNIRLHPLEEFWANYTFMNSPSRGLPFNGLQLIEGTINPLVAYQEGRHFVDGHQFSFETVHRANFSKYFSLYFRPRFEALFPDTGATKTQPIVQQLYAKFAFRNLQIEAGRDSIIWGQGEFGGGLLSNNARPLDMIRVGGISPFFLPSFLKYLGPSQFNFFAANLGPAREFPYSFLIGGMGTIKPFSFFEFSMGQTLVMGGRGAPHLNTLDAIEEFFGILSRTTGKNISNRIAVVEGRLTLPMFRNTQLYQEFIVDDIFKKSYINTLKDVVYYITGIYIPRVNSDGSADLRLEFKHFAGLAYRHNPFIAGYTLNTRLLGDELGPDSYSFSAKGNIDINEHFRLPLALYYEWRGSDEYGVTYDGEDTVGFFTTKEKPAERRYRLETGLFWDSQKALRAELRLGYEHVHNFGFDISSNRNNFLGSLTLILRPEGFH